MAVLPTVPLTVPHCRSKERYDEIEGKLTPFLRGCGYNPKKDLLFIPLSGLMGLNMKERVPTEVCSWYNVSRGERGAAELGPPANRVQYSTACPA